MLPPMLIFPMEAGGLMLAAVPGAIGEGGRGKWQELPAAFEWPDVAGDGGAG